ncbi:MAG: hypothetical protein DDG60_14485 [Anaerolineae bacterium]|nr:MAG: hypothetical protein DDG60_14485 [Anaerolineae bacterium]
MAINHKTTERQKALLTRQEFYVMIFTEICAAGQESPVWLCNWLSHMGSGVRFPNTLPQRAAPCASKQSALQVKPSAERLRSLGQCLSTDDETMEYLLTLLLSLALVLVLSILIRPVTIFEHQRGLLYRRGKFIRILEPGARWIFRPWETVQQVDIRLKHITLSGQEILTKDNISLKISLAAAYRVADPYKALTQSQNYEEALYLMLQIHLRDVIGTLLVEELLSKRAEIGNILLEKGREPACELGLELSLVNIKDIMFPGDLKAIFAQVVQAKMQGLAALEKARGESAALRNLANTEQLFANHPHLMQLRLLQTLETQAGKNLVILPTEWMTTLNRQKEK